jgi:Flp pilus assembly protein TadB
VSVIDEDYDRLRKKVEAELRTGTNEQPVSSVYQEFKKQYMPRSMGFYERCCQFAEGLHIKPSPADEVRYREAFETCHLNATPAGAYGLAFLVSMSLLFLGIVAAALPVLLGTGNFSLFFFILFVAVAGIVFMPLRNLPFTLADEWRMRASNQMVLCLFYITTYMRHTSNLENAVDFAADHIGPPLSLDLKKVIWDVQTEKHASFKDSLDAYLAQWRQSNLEFVQSMNLVQGSLYESSEERRLNSLEKAMNLMLDETYERMLHYAQNLKSPMTMLHMLGVILPVLGLVILPLAVSFLSEVRWFHIAVLYNVLLPLGVYFLGKSILSKRPSGYGNADITDINPDLKKYQKNVMRSDGTALGISPLTLALLVGGLLFFIGTLPILIHTLSPGFDIAFGPFKMLDYVVDSKSGDLVGPYGLVASILSLFLILGLGLGLAYYYLTRSKKIITIRDETKALEQEFAGALFQLGNRLGDGIPAELAFSKVADVMEGTKSGEFFRVVAVNIQKMGMSVEQAIFDSKRGAILLYPSPLIESSMKVLIESSKKGPLEASKSLITMSNYIKEIHRVEERLKDLMADVISGMRSQITFLTPAIAGIVIGITSMITTILISLQLKIQEFGQAGATASGPVGLGELLGIGIPTYYFQAIVGIYVIQITWILAYLVNGIENGHDDINKEYEQGRGLFIGTLLYIGIAFTVMLIFNLIAGRIMSGL